MWKWFHINFHIYNNKEVTDLSIPMPLQCCKEHTNGAGHRIACHDWTRPTRQFPASHQLASHQPALLCADLAKRKGCFSASDLSCQGQASWYFQFHWRLFYSICIIPVSRHVIPKPLYLFNTICQENKVWAEAELGVEAGIQNWNGNKSWPCAKTHWCFLDKSQSRVRVWSHWSTEAELEDGDESQNWAWQ